MKTIHEYTSIVCDNFELIMHEGAEILNIRIRNVSDLIIYALIDTDKPYVTRKFGCCPTGKNITGMNWKYIGTFELGVSERYVGHLMEKTESINPIIGKKGTEKCYPTYAPHLILGTKRSILDFI